MQTKRKIAVLGSTGSIGTQALQVAALHSDRFQITALTANRSKEKLFEQVRQFRPQLAGLVEPISMEEIPDDLKFCQWVFGPECLTLAAQTDCDDVLVSVVGMAGLKGVLEAFLQNKRVLLANKEALVTGGHLVMEAARKAGEHSLLPVDSEHSAIFQCLQGAAGNPIDKIILTCSGGPFRTWDKAAIRSATKAQALKHPNWVMGQKITIDSATLFNKALEIMEAKWLFGVEDDRIQVVVHPQSVIHSGVQFADGALIAQPGHAGYAPAHPVRHELPGTFAHRRCAAGCVFPVRPDLRAARPGTLSFPAAGPRMPAGRRCRLLRAERGQRSGRGPFVTTAFTTRRRESHDHRSNL